MPYIEFCGYGIPEGKPMVKVLSGRHVTEVSGTPKGRQ